MRVVLAALFACAFANVGAAVPLRPSDPPCVAIDGDTLRCGEVRIRLADIDAPELRCAGGREARDALAAMIAGRRLTFAGERRDQYRRLVRRVEASGIGDLGEAMIAAGHALPWPGGRGPRPWSCR